MGDGCWGELDAARDAVGPQIRTCTRYDSSFRKSSRLSTKRPQIQSYGQRVEAVREPVISTRLPQEKSFSKVVCMRSFMALHVPTLGNPSL
jgi:hypothetical protein